MAFWCTDAAAAAAAANISDYLLKVFVNAAADVITLFRQTILHFACYVLTQ